MGEEGVVLNPQRRRLSCWNHALGLLSPLDLGRHHQSITSVVPPKPRLSLRTFLNPGVQGTTSHRSELAGNIKPIHPSLPRREAVQSAAAPQRPLLLGREHAPRQPPGCIGAASWLRLPRSALAEVPGVFSTCIGSHHSYQASVSEISFPLAP